MKRYKIILSSGLIILLLLGFHSVVFADSESGSLTDFFQLGKSPLSTVNPANTSTRELIELYLFISYIALAIFAVVVFLFLYILYRYHWKRNPVATQTHGSTKLEITWTVIPIIIVIAILIPTIRLIMKQGTIPNPGDKASINILNQDTANSQKKLQKYDRYLEVNAIGHQWWWEFEYVGYYIWDSEKTEARFVPISKVTANEPWFPINTPIKLNLTSEDVIHSFWLPRLAGKIDMIPGNINHLTFVVEEKGVYWGQCAEYCGASHALMRFSAKGVSAEKFKIWSEWGKGDLVFTDSKQKQGKSKFMLCMGCHTFNGVRDFKPRQARLEKGLKRYQRKIKTYTKRMKQFHAGKRKKKPKVPKLPKLYEGSLKTLAPDLTDLRFRSRILAGIKDNNHQNLKEWIREPSAIKPEISGTKTLRMLAYKDIITEEELNNVLDFLLNVEYSQSQAVNIDTQK